MKKVVAVLLGSIIVFCMSSCEQYGNSSSISNWNSSLAIETNDLQNEDSLSASNNDSSLAVETNDSQNSEQIMEQVEVINGNNIQIGDEISPYLVGYKVDAVSAYTDAITIQIAVSLFSFPIEKDVSELKLFLRTSNEEEYLLETYLAENFTQGNYGCVISYDEQGNISKIEFNSYKKYSIDIELFSGEGLLSFELRTYISGGAQGSSGFVSLYYVNKDNMLYFQSNL